MSKEKIRFRIFISMPMTGKTKEEILEEARSYYGISVNGLIEVTVY